MGRNRKLTLTSGPAGKGLVDFRPLSTDGNPLNGVRVQGPDSVGASPLDLTLPASVVDKGLLKTSSTGAIISELLKDNNVDAAAAIALSKLAALTASKALVSDSSGVVSPSAVTSIELGYLSGVTSAIQTQLNALISSITGDVTASVSGGVATTSYNNTVPINKGGTGQTTANAALNALLPSQTGNSGKVLTSDGANTSWLNASATVVPTGAVIPFAGTSAPSGYLMCDGREVSRTTYSALFSAIGVAFGHGDNSTTFNLPDMRGNVIRGVSNSPGVSFTTTDVNTGTNEITVTAHDVKYTGAPVHFVDGISPGNGDLPTPFNDTTIYYAIIVDANTLKFAASRSDALAGTAITITSTGELAVNNKLQSGNDIDIATRGAQATGANTGDAPGSVQTDDFKSHVHGVDVTPTPWSAAGSSQSNFADNTSPYRYSNTTATGGNETRPVNLYMNHIIKT